MPNRENDPTPDFSNLSDSDNSSDANFDFLAREETGTPHQSAGRQLSQIKKRSSQRFWAFWGAIIAYVGWKVFRMLN